MKIEKLKIAKNILWTSFRAIILFVLLCSSYYFIWLEPDRQLAVTLTDIEQDIAPHYFALLTNRLSFFELARLDINRSDYLREKDGIMANLKATREQNRRLLDEAIDAAYPSRFLFTRTRRLQNQLAVGFNDLRNQHQQALSDQIELMTTLDTLDQAISKLAEYPAQQDLASLNLEDQGSEVIHRAANTKNALIDIRTIVARADLPADTRSSLTVKISTAIDALSRIITQAEQQEQQISSLADTINDAVTQFDSLQSLILDSYIKTLSQNNSVDILTEETNIILGYKHLLDTITYEQGRIYQQYAATEG